MAILAAALQDRGDVFRESHRLGARRLREPVGRGATKRCDKKDKNGFSHDLLPVAARRIPGSLPIISDAGTMPPKAMVFLHVQLRQIIDDAVTIG